MTKYTNKELEHMVSMYSMAMFYSTIHIGYSCKSFIFLIDLIFHISWYNWRNKILMNEQKGCFGNNFWHFSNYGPHITVCIHFGMTKLGKQSSFHQNLIHKILLPPIFLHLHMVCMWIKIDLNAYVIRHFA